MKISTFADKAPNLLVLFICLYIHELNFHLPVKDLRSCLIRVLSLIKIRKHSGCSNLLPTFVCSRQPLIGLKLGHWQNRWKAEVEHWFISCKQIKHRDYVFTQYLKVLPKGIFQVFFFFLQPLFFFVLSGFVLRCLFSWSETCLDCTFHLKS